MARKRNRIKDDDRIALKGKARTFHKIARFILFPIFHPFIMLFILFMLWLTPTFLGAKPTTVHLWYKQKIDEIFVKKIIEPIKTEVATHIGIEPLYEIRAEKPKEKKDPNYDVNARRKIFAKVQENKKNVFAKKEEVLTRPDLTYLKVPEMVVGNVLVINANQILVGKKFMFFHGIYIDPNSELGKEAEAFLTNLFDNKEVFCNVVAYSNKGDATAFCKLDGVDVNRLLVEKGLSKNVGLGE